MITPSSAGRSVQDPVRRRLRGASASPAWSSASSGVIVAAAAGCAHGHVPIIPPAAPVEHLEMEPIKITAVKRARRRAPRDLRRHRAVRARRQGAGGEALRRRHRDYDRLLKEFPDTRLSKPALYNCGLAYQGRKDWQDRPRALPAAGRRVSRDVRRQGRDLPDWCHLRRARGLGRPRATTFAQMLERKDLTADDRIEALARRGYAQFQLKDLDTAERTFSSAVVLLPEHREGRAAADRLLSRRSSSTTSGRSRTSASGRSRCDCPRSRWRWTWMDKARLLLTAQRQYIDTIKLGQPAVGRGVRLPDRLALRGVLRLLHPRPDSARALRPEANRRSARSTTRSCARRSASCWRSRSGRTRQNLLMIERLGVQSEWRDKSKLAFAKLQQMLDPSFNRLRPATRPETRVRAGTGAGAGSPERPPPIPTAPERSARARQSRAPRTGARRARSSNER